MDGAPFTESLVFLPDMACDGRLFGPQIVALSADMPVTVAPTNRGERLEEIASGLLGLLPPRVALAGSGFGGVVALEILRRAPERVQRIALIGSTALGESPQTAGNREEFIAKARAGRLEDVLVGHIAEAGLAQGPQSAEVHALLMEMGRRMGPEAFVRQSRAMQRRRDQQAMLRKLKLPALVIGGGQDTMFPVKRQQVLAELIPHAQLKVFESAGHWPTLEAADQVTDALAAWFRQPLVLR